MNKTPKTQPLCHAHPALCFLVTILVASTVHAQDDNNIYCLQIHRDIGVGEVYNSGVFSEDFGSTLGYENDFYDYLESRGFRPDITESYCFLEATLTEAEQALLSDVEGASRDSYAVVRTDWRPEESSALPDEPFSPQPLRDFRISVPGMPLRRRCVREGSRVRGWRPRARAYQRHRVVGRRDRQRVVMPNTDAPEGATRHRAVRGERNRLQRSGLQSYRR